MSRELKYKESIGKLLREKGFHSGEFRKWGEEHHPTIHQATLTRLNKEADEIDIDITLSTALKISYFLDKDLEDLVEFEPDEETRMFKEKVLAKNASNKGDK